MSHAPLTRFNALTFDRMQSQTKHSALRRYSAEERALGSTVSRKIMPSLVRERVSIDLRSLGPTVRALASARGLKVSALVRTAVVALVDRSESLATVAPTVTSVQCGVKLTLRLKEHSAQNFVRQAKLAGLSYGDYLTTLLDGFGPEVVLEQRHAIEALRQSVDLLAPVLSDLKDLGRSLRVPPNEDTAGRRIDMLTRAIQQHLVLASTLLAETQPAARAQGRVARLPPALPSGL